MNETKETTAEEIASDNAAADAEYACGLMTWARPVDEGYDQRLEAAEQKAFDEWHKLGPQSAQY